MQIEGNIALPGSPQEIYAALSDPEVLARCIGSCDRFERLSDTEYSAAATLKIGPVKTAINVAILLSDLNLPQHWTINATAQSRFGGGSATTQVWLQQTESGTDLRYAAKASLSGKLAHFAGSWTDRAAKPHIDSFFARFADIVTERQKDKPVPVVPEPTLETNAIVGEPEHKTTDLGQMGIRGAGFKGHKKEFWGLGKKSWAGIGAAAGVAVVAGLAALLRKRG